LFRGCCAPHLSPGICHCFGHRRRTGLAEENPEKLPFFFNTDFPPIEFAASSGQFTGMGADLIALVEQQLGIRFIKRPSQDWNQHLAALESGECAVAPTIVRTDERERYALFTVPYATVPVVLITTRAIQGTITLNTLPGRRLGVVSGYATEPYLRDLTQGRFEVVPVANVSEGLRKVSFGELDAFAENLAVAAYAIERDGLPNLRVAGNTDYVFAWSIGVCRKYPLLHSSIQKALAAIPPARLEEVQRIGYRCAPTDSLRKPFACCNWPGFSRSCCSWASRPSPMCSSVVSINRLRPENSAEKNPGTGRNAATGC
jgi:ABC-type amino acid transport substrate-binding protein